MTQWKMFTVIKIQMITSREKFLKMITLTYKTFSKVKTDNTIYGILSMIVNESILQSFKIWTNFNMKKFQTQFQIPPSAW